jgi:hypothetical protein
MSNNSDPIPDKIKDQMKMFLDAYDKSKELHSGDAGKAKAWLLEPNTCFFNASPLHWILGGKGQGIIDFLDERMGEEEK